MAEKGLGLEISEFSRNRLKEHEEPRKTGKKCHCGGDIVLKKRKEELGGYDRAIGPVTHVRTLTDCFCGACGLIYNPAVLGVS